MDLQTFRTNMQPGNIFTAHTRLYTIVSADPAGLWCKVMCKFMEEPMMIQHGNPDAIGLDLNITINSLIYRTKIHYQDIKFHLELTDKTFQ